MPISGIMHRGSWIYSPSIQPSNFVVAHEKVDEGSSPFIYVNKQRIALVPDDLAAQPFNALRNNSR
jgi:hypothetical protein